MEEKKTIYNLVLDCWDLMKRYAFQERKLTGTEWQSLVNEQMEKVAHYRGYSEAVGALYRAVSMAIVNYIESKERSGK